MRKALAWSVAPIGLIALMLTGMIYLVDTSPPSPMRSVIDVATSVDTSDLPPILHFAARDGAQLAYRAYPAKNEKKIAILIHGSSDSSVGMHAAGRALAQNGVTAFALDMRGHGSSGSRGDIRYIGQLEDDLADFVSHLRNSQPSAPLTLVGHSSGGGFVLRVAGSKMNRLFSNYVVTAPYLQYDAPTSRGTDGGGWAKPFIPRIIAIGFLHRIGIAAFDGLPVLAFALPEKTPLTKTYSYRLFSNFRPDTDYLKDFSQSNSTISLLVGQNDEIFVADQYAVALESVKGKVHIEIIPDVGHMGAVSNPAALKRVVDAVRRI